MSTRLDDVLKTIARWKLPAEIQRLADEIDSGAVPCLIQTAEEDYHLAARRPDGRIIVDSRRFDLTLALLLLGHGLGHACDWRLPCLVADEEGVILGEATPDLAAGRVVMRQSARRPWPKWRGRPMPAMPWAGQPDRGTVVPSREQAWT